MTDMAPSGWMTLELGCFDEQLTAALDGRPILRTSWAAAGLGSTQPWRVAASGANIEIQHLRIYRDLYYATRPGSQLVLHRGQHFRGGFAVVFSNQQLVTDHL